jgi:hypothetical protein
VPAKLGDTVFHHADVLLDLREEDGPLDRGHQEARERGGLDVRGEGAERPGSRQGRGQALAPLLEPVGQPLSEPLVGIGQLGGQVAEGAAAHAVPSALIGQDLVEKLLHLTQGVAVDILEDGRQRPRLEPPEEPVEDGVAQLLFGVEVMIEIALSGSTLPEDLVERGAVVPAGCHQPGGDLQDLLLDGRLAHGCTDRSVN